MELISAGERYSEGGGTAWENLKFLGERGMRFSGSSLAGACAQDNTPKEGLV